MTLSKPTLWFYLAPSRFIDTEVVVGYDIEAFSAQFIWEQDPLSGYWDTVTPVEETLETKRGDCDDYAALAASWLRSLDRDVTIAFCIEPRSLLPNHVVAVGPDHVYSSGNIYAGSLDDYIDRSAYSRTLTRSL